MSWVEEFRAHEAIYRRAPSAHNTQPWTLEYRADEIVIGIDPARALPGSDPGGRDLRLGLGAFVETCLIVAADAGLSVTYDSRRLLAAPSPYVTPFTAADVSARRVARGAYRPGVVSTAGLEPGLVHVPSRDLADDLAVADRWMFSTPRVALELRDWLRLDPGDPRYRLDGLTDRALELSRGEARVLASALRAYPVTRRLGLAALLAASGRNLLRYDGSVLVLTGDVSLDAGRRLLRTWLTLGRSGLAVHPLSQLLDCPATAARLAARVGATPLAVFRVGVPLHEPVRSARRP
ncbi:nitroreductase [Actinoplanes friuliensis]|jgi:hypothetical protein|uniref:Nitroreductase n=1 Tax=Actinoplanes friuliensis DSM 7358 TaxID=1246995 RepID=U5VWL0_9ACTN|nr:nitroreductase [Actinoplanes friuliensis]AGZ41393.1 nitroreductase [Actinoplanes friuliensis DSM 7358]